MAKKQKVSREEQVKAEMEKMQKRVENLLPPKAEIPASISIQEAEELKARVSELQAQLAQQTEEVQQKSVPVVENITPDRSGNEAKQTNHSKRPRLINNAATSETKKQLTGQTEERQMQLGLWAAGIFTAVGLAFLVYSIYIVVAVQQGRFDLSDKILMPISAMMFVTSIISYGLIRRGRHSLGTGLLFFSEVLVPPVIAVLVLKDFLAISVTYIVLLAFIMISLIMPKKSRVWAITATLATVLLTIGIEYWDPGFRVYTGINGFVNIITALAGLGLLGFLLRQAWRGKLRNKLLAAFIGVTIIATGILSAFVIVTTTNTLRGNLGRDLSAVAVSRATQLGDLFNEQIDNLTALSLGEVLQGRVREQNRSYQGDAATIQAEIDAKDTQWRTADAANDNSDFLVRERLSNAAARDLLEYQKVFPDNAEILITDINGGLAAATNRTSDYNQADEAWWQAAYNDGKGAIYISDPQFDASSNTLGIQVALPFRERVSGNIIGILRTTYIMTPLTDILKQDIGQNSSADIFIPGETVSRIRGGVLETIDSQVLKKLEAVAGQGMTEMDYEGTPSVVSQALVQSRNGNQTIKNLGWIVVFHQNQVDAFAPVNAQIRGIIIVIAIIILVAVLAAILMAQVLARPLTQLTNTAQEIAAGNLNSQAQVTSSDEIGILAGAFNSMTAQLRDFIGSLEQRVTDRTHDLELAAEVGSTIAEKVENTSVMLTDATEMIRSRFNLYYTQVYLLEPSGQTITLRAGTGEAGKQLLQRGHHLLVNSSSLNGRAVSEKRPVIVADTQTSGTFLPNPLLPNTRSEMAIPLLVGDKVLGVLDMQSETPNALSEDNLAAFQVLAGQLSVAIQNATLFAQSEEARKQVETNARQITTSGWQDYLNGTDRGEKIGYVFDQTEVKPIERKSKAQAGNALSIPITVTGATVGSIQVAQDEREWTSNETLVIQSTAEQLAQHIENLRLLSQAEKYRQEAEQTTRRLTREGWEGYLQTRTALAESYSFTPNEVKDKNEDLDIESAAISLPITVRDESIGELTINADHIDTKDMDEIFFAVASQLGEHIENLRLLETTENELVERTRAEKELLRVRLGMDRTNDAVFITETDGTIIYVNPAFERIYGWTPKEAIGQTPRILKSGVIPAEQYKHFWSALKSNQVVAGEIINKTKDGRLIPIEGNNNPIVDADGEIIGFLGMHRDITERKNAQEIIARRASELQTVATVSSTAATMLDPDKLLQAVVDLTKERFNVYHTHIYLADESWNTLLLAAGAGEVGRQMVDDGHAIQMDAERSLVARASRERKSIIVNDIRAEAGFLPNPMLPETRSEIAVPMIAGDKVIGVFDVQADAVDHFTDEDANIYTTLASQVAVALQNARLYVEQAATVTQLRELDRLKSSFLANMSHELRTPLNSILGFADVMLEGLDGPLTENMNNDLGLIQKNGQHLLHLINDVLDMAKIDSGKMNLHIEKFNVNELFMDVISITSSLAKEKSLKLVIEGNSDQEVEVNADKIRLRQVMINLVNNAMKFTEKGQVTICARREENNVLISVKDSGIGIPADHLESVFQEFTQVDTTTTRKAGGTGLGLPISRRLINMHSGRLWAESSGINGEGSTFYVDLPIDANINENVTLAAQ